jgi:hypothetical protein
MGGKSKTTKVYAPSAQETANAQGQANLDAIYASAMANRYNEVTPFGSVTWDRPQAPVQSKYKTVSYGGKQYRIPNNTVQQQGQGQGASVNDLAGWTRTTTLSPEMQRQFDLQNRLAQRLQGDAVLKASQMPRNQFQIDGNLPEMASGLDTSQLPEMQTGLDTSQLPELNKDYSGDAQRVEQATYDRIQQLINPQYEQRQRALESQLAATGNPLGSEGYMTEQDRFQRSRDEADLAAALESVGAGRAEQSRLFDIASRSRGQLTGEQLANAGLTQQARQQGISEQMTDAELARVARQQGISEDQLVRNQNINELAALIQGSPAIQMPQSAQPAQYQVAPTDVLGANQMSLNAQLQNAAMQNQSNAAKKGGTSGLIGTLGSAAIQTYSDRRLKTDINPVINMDGYQYYSFAWNEDAEKLGLQGRSFGVMADEIEQLRPDLVSINPKNGYKMVDYGGLNA